MGLQLNSRWTGPIVAIAFSLLLNPTLKAQGPPPCASNWWAKCCICANCLVVDKLPQFGYCRHCNLLCGDCRKKIGNLDSELERLKQENRQLMDKLKAYQRSANEHNAKLTDALIKTYGQESGHWTFSDPSSWRNLTGSGFNSSLGKFATSSAALLADLNGAGLPMKILVNVISTAQSESGVDAATNVNGILFDILSEDRLLTAFEIEMIRNAGLKFGEELRNARNLKGAAFHQAFMRAKRNFVREARFVDNFSKATKKIDFGNTLFDIYQFIQAGADLLSNLYNIYDNYRIREAALKERLATQERIVKNVKLMACIRETKDSLDGGGLGKAQGQGGNLSITLLAGGPVSMRQLELFGTDDYDFFDPQNEAYWEVDTFRIRAAITQLRNLQTNLNQTIKVFADEVVPPLTPWILKRHEQLSAETRIFLLKSLKPPINSMISLHKTAMAITDRAGENIAAIVIGQEMFYLTGVSGQGGSDNTNLNAGDRWFHKPNSRIKGDVGRMNMSFPQDADWSIDFYTAEKKFVTNRSKAGKQNFADLAPGVYILQLNSVPAGQVVLEKGKETVLKVGFLDMALVDEWYLYSGDRKTYHTSGNKPVKLALPLGNYILRVGEKDYRVVIRDKTTVKFEMPIPGMEE